MQIALTALAATFCAFPGGTAVAGNAPQEQARVGAGDERSGYDSRDFRTRSESLTGSYGVDARLHRLARKPPLGLPPLSKPPDADHIHLGRQLFFDRRLSGNRTLSCGMCHVPEQAFTQNELRTPVGIEGRFVNRNAPSLYNVSYLPVLFHDGRESALAEQIWAPLLARNEMGNASREALIERLRQIPEYDKAFTKLFPEGLSENSLGIALAAYQRALLSADSPFDRWFYGGASGAMSPSAKRGFFLFRSRGCSDCHLLSNEHALFTDHDFHNTGVGYLSALRNSEPPSHLQVAPGVTIPITVSASTPDRTDYGREAITSVREDRWKFRTPGLRNIALTAPYMHDGSIATLGDVVAFYDRGGGGDPAQDSQVRPLDMTPQERTDLVKFLESLTGANVDALAADARTAPIGDNR